MNPAPVTVNHRDAEELAWIKRGESNLARCYLAALAALEAASFYINASERELTDGATTRSEALRRFHELQGPIGLALEEVARARGNHVDYANGPYTQPQGAQGG